MKKNVYTYIYFKKKEANAAKIYLLKCEQNNLAEINFSCKLEDFQLKHILLQFELIMTYIFFYAM